MRSGTLNVPAIAGLGKACRLRQLEMAEDEQTIALLRDKLQNLLQEKISNLVVNEDITSRLAGNLHISIPKIPNSAIIARIRVAKHAMRKHRQSSPDDDLGIRPVRRLIAWLFLLVQPVFLE